MLTSLSERLITESCLADLESVPFLAIERLIYINDVEVFVHPAKRSQYGGDAGRTEAVDTRRK